MKLGHATLIAIIAAVAVCLVPAAATAATYQKGEATCYPSWIFANPIVMKPTNVDLSGGSTFTWGGTETVAFQANLAKLIGGTWYTVQYGRWKFKNVPRGGDYGEGYSTLASYDLQTGAETSGTTTFQITSSGRYRVYYNMYWYATGESAWDWADHRDVRTNVWDLFTHPGCDY